MHKYLHHIGDFMRDTSHLSPVEECFYRRAIDWYYLNEKPFPNDMKEVCRLLRAKGKIQTQAVETVFNDFFFAEENYLKNSRCEKEIAAYKGKNISNRVNGKLGGRPKKNNDLKNHDGFDSVSAGLENDAISKPNQKATNNHKPITINQEPIYEKEEVLDSEISDPRFNLSLNDVNIKLQMGGLKTISQEELQSLLVKLQSSYGHKTQMVKNQILGKAFEWIERQQRTPLQQPRAQVSKSTAQTLAEQRAAMNQNQYQGQIIDVGEPKKTLMIEEVGRA